jgi:hypothetical protein
MPKMGGRQPQILSLADRFWIMAISAANKPYPSAPASLNLQLSLPSWSRLKP